MENALDNQEQLFQLAGEIEALKEELKYKQERLDVVLMVLGPNTYHQDSVNGVVYKVHVPQGTFIEYKHIAYKRTGMPGEKGGHLLAKVEAEAQGFKLLK
jgi:hypothetical protein